MHDVRTIFHLITVRNEVIFSQASVSHFVQSGEGPQCMLGYTHPQSGTPPAPWAGTPPDRYTLGRYTPSLGRYTPHRYTPAPRQAHPPGR